MNYEVFFRNPHGQLPSQPKFITNFLAYTSNMIGNSEFEYEVNFHRHSFLLLVQFPLLFLHSHLQLVQHDIFQCFFSRRDY